MQQRYYDPIAGRFLSVDPVTTDANTGELFGRYHYANNNPYRFMDPDGRQSWPVEKTSDGRVIITSGFGPRNTGIPGASTNHNGTDFRARQGAAIMSAQDGKIASIDNREKGGDTIYIANNDGSMNGYAHTAAASGLKVGDAVSEGQKIGTSNGSGTKQPHLHFTYMQGSTDKRATEATPRVDPMTTQFKDKPKSESCVKGKSCG